jgi:hypothetical protein
MFDINWTDSANKQPVKCPVCKKKVGAKSPNAPYWGRCEECKTALYYGPYETVPSKATPDSFLIKRKQCNCVNCKKRDSR